MGLIAKKLPNIVVQKGHLVQSTLLKMPQYNCVILCITAMLAPQSVQLADLSRLLSALSLLDSNDIRSKHQAGLLRPPRSSLLEKRIRTG